MQICSERKNIRKEEGKCLKTDLLRGDGLLVDPAKFFDGLRIRPQVFLTTNEDDGQVRAEVQDFSDPLFLHVVEGIWRVDSEADEDDVGVWVGQRSQSVVVFLASSIPESQLADAAVDLDFGDIILKDGRDVDL